MMMMMMMIIIIIIIITNTKNCLQEDAAGKQIVCTDNNTEKNCLS